MLLLAYCGVFHNHPFCFLITQELQWLQSAMISLSPDNKSIIVTCDVTEASPRAKCLVTINCTKCREDPFTTKSFMESIELIAVPAKEYVITVQVVRADTNESLEEYIITRNIQVPRSKESSDNSGIYAWICVFLITIMLSVPALSTDDDDDDTLWIYVGIVVAVLVVVVVGILLVSIVTCYIITKRSENLLLYD